MKKKYGPDVSFMLAFLSRTPDLSYLNEKDIDELLAPFEDDKEMQSGFAALLIKCKVRRSIINCEPNFDFADKVIAIRNK